MEDSGEQQKNLSQKEKRRQYYEKNKFALCNYTINIYPVKKIEKIRALCPEKADEYITRYPFDEYAEGYIKKRLAIQGVSSTRSHYHDCYAAGVMAYLFSVHRCAEMSYDHL